MLTKETQFIKNQIDKLGRCDKLNLLSYSSLNDREIDLLTKRFVCCLSLKECSELYGLEINTVSKNQQKAIKKLYQYIINK